MKGIFPLSAKSDPNLRRRPPRSKRLKWILGERPPRSEKLKC